MTIHRIVTPDNFDDVIAEAVAALAEGALVSFPTETVYGLGADIRQRSAAARLYQVKGRPTNKPFALLVASPEAARPYVKGLPPHARILMARFWPGPLTIIVRRSAAVPAEVVAGQETVGLRCPDHPVAMALARALGAPIVASSANLSGAPASLHAAEVLHQLRDRIELLLEGGPLPNGQPSTVLDATTLPLRLLRTGELSAEFIRSATGLPVEEGSGSQRPDT